jgi:hypothetical protein
VRTAPGGRAQGRAGHPSTPARAMDHQAVVLAAPALVPLTMGVVFTALARRASPPVAYNLGFGIYWLGWCVAFPAWVLGPRRAWRVLVSGRPPSATERWMLWLAPAGAALTQLWPRREDVDGRTAAVMVSTGVLNAAGEELLWRGVFVETFPTDVLRGALWPLAGFALWHLAPQLILPSSMGRSRFVLGAALVGAASTFSAWRSRGLRSCLLPHAATDVCGVVAARFRLGRPVSPGSAVRHDSRRW